MDGYSWYSNSIFKCLCTGKGGKKELERNEKGCQKLGFFLCKLWHQCFTANKEKEAACS